MDHNYFVYFLTDKGRKTLYIGFTNDLAVRLWQHRNPDRASFTQHCHCILLVYVEHFPDVNAASAREKQRKGWTRAKKNALIEKVNPRWEDLSADWVCRTPGRILEVLRLRAAHVCPPALRSG